MSVMFSLDDGATGFIVEHGKVDDIQSSIELIVNICGSHGITLLTSTHWCEINPDVDVLKRLDPDNPYPAIGIPSDAHNGEPISVVMGSPHAVLSLPTEVYIDYHVEECVFIGIYK